MMTTRKFNPEKVWFSSDLHWHHRRIQEFCPDTRSQGSLEEMNWDIVGGYEGLPHDAEIFLLGDISFGTEDQTMELLSALPGRLHLVYGNHDKVIRNSPRLQKQFDTLADDLEITVGKQHIVLHHFAKRVWHKAHYGSFHFYGHSHGTLPGTGRSMDVGIDARPGGDMKPWSYAEVAALMSAQPFPTHH